MLKTNDDNNFKIVKLQWISITGKKIRKRDKKTVFLLILKK